MWYPRHICRAALGLNLHQHSNKMQSFLGNDNVKHDIMSFLNDTRPRTLIVVAPVGSGKTTLCNIALNLCSNYKVWTPDLETSDNHKIFTEQISNFLTCKEIIQTTTSNINQSKLLFFDDIEILFVQDRYANTYVQQLISESKIKILITCSTGEEKRLTEIKKKKNVTICRLEPPQIEVIVEKYGESYRNKAIACGGNVGMMLRNNDINAKFFDKNIYDIVENLFLNNNGFEDLEYALSYDASLIGFMMYDNFQNVFERKCTMTTTKKHETFSKIFKTYLDTSLLEDCSFFNNDWMLLEIINLIRCSTISLEFKKQNQKKRQQVLDINYTQIPSRSAQRYNIIKKYGTLLHYNFNNIALMSEIMLSKKEKPCAKSTEGSIMNTYIYNFCKG